MLIWFFVLLFFSQGAFACSPNNSTPNDLHLEAFSDTVRILTYNVRNCRGLDDSVDYQRIADIILRIDADIVALQELDSATTRSNHVAVLTELAKLTGLHATYSASIDYQGGKYGIGTLSKKRPLSVEKIALPGTEERRSVLIMEMGNYYLANTHFSLTESDRLKSLYVINQAVSDLSKPVFLAGDINAVPESELLARFGLEWFILNDPLVPTIPANNPNKCIDFIFLRKSNGLKHTVLTTKVEAEPVASDHLPVWVDVVISNQ